MQWQYSYAKVYYYTFCVHLSGKWWVGILKLIWLLVYAYVYQSRNIYKTIVQRLYSQIELKSYLLN